MHAHTPRLRAVSAAIMAIALLGIFDSGYLTAHKLFGTPLKCGAYSGCETVAQSAYSSVFGIPLSLIGMLFYFTMFMGALVYREFDSEKSLKAVSWLTVASILTSAWLVGIQLFIIHAVCFYCMASAVFSFILVNLGVHTLLTLKKATRQTSAPSPSPTASDLG